MHRLRHARRFARLVLAWFALAIGVAVAAPVVQPHSYEMLCTGGGPMKMVTLDHDGGEAQEHEALDCCLACTTGAPPPAASVALPAAQPLGRAVQPIPSARLASLVSAPLPARGPPALLPL